MQPLELQLVCDKYPHTVNIKGGSRPLLATDIHICSNKLPDGWWGPKTNYVHEAILRRIHIVHWHYEFKKIRVYKSDTPGQYENCAMVKFLAAHKEANPIFNTHVTGMDYIN